MEAINVLQNKAKGTVLFDSVLGENVLFERLEGNRIICSNNDKEQTYKGNGKLFNNADAIVVLTPSRNMQDWSKFAWKKGDVLKQKESYVIFDYWLNTYYTCFRGVYLFGKSSAYEVCCNTDDFIRAKQPEIDTYISVIEKEYGGKLNLETLKIEQPKQEFRDGDIVVVKTKDREEVFIKKANPIAKTAFYAAYNLSSKNLCCQYRESICREQDIKELRLATDSERSQLLSALKNEDKIWDARNKMLVNLPKKCELKPFDKVLVRNNDVETWIPTLFGFYDKEFENYVCMGDVFEHCIPYNEETKHLLGTTEEWKGANNG